MASYEYFLWFSDQQYGPYSSARVSFDWRANKIPSAALYWREGMPDWQPLALRDGALPMSDEPIPFSREFLVKLRDDLAAEVEAGRKKLLPLVLLFLLPVLTLVSCEKQQSAESVIPLPPIQPITATPEDRDAFAEACDSVLPHLKSPGSAKFCPLEKAQLSHDPDGSWSIFGWVDSQNLNGTLLRSDWHVKMEYDSDAATRHKITECTVY